MRVKTLAPRRTTVIFSLLFFVALLPLLGDDQGRDQASGSDPLAVQAAAAGSIRVIVKLAVPRIQELTAVANSFGCPAPGKEKAWDGAQADLALRDAILNAAQGVLVELQGKSYEVIHIYKSIPYMALRASAEVIAVLRGSAGVLDIIEDKPRKLIQPVADDDAPKGEPPAATTTRADPPLLDNTTGIVGATAAWSMGYTGSGWYVAILDTGIRKAHEFFTGKTVVEACFASGSDGVGPAGDCPNGLVSMTGSGSAIHYSSTYDGYDHGTHVSGIATGNNGSLYGVAKDANIVAVQVFSKFSASDCGSADPCVMSWDSDQVAGLDHVYSIRGSYSIAAVNMSLGGGQYSSACDSEPQKAAIDNLRSAGIATVIATGNSGYCDAISSPGCISTCVAVGSTTDADLESSFNNWDATLQKLFAPGSAIYSSTGASNSSYESWSGTSMATPHVTGAWALIKDAAPSASVADVLAALQGSGVPITSVCDGYTAAIPRIQVDDAIMSLIGSSRVDFNHDGKTDLLWRHQSSGKDLAWYMNGVSKTGSASLPTQADLNWDLVANPADFNSDGMTDVLWRHVSSGKNVVWYLNGVAKTGSASLPTQADMSWELVECADLNNDGKTDLLWRHATTGKNVVWYMNGVARTATAYLPTLSDMDWALVGCGDFNADAKTDILWRNTSTGQNAVWYMNGASRTGTAYLSSLTTMSWHVADCADINGDKKPDILWRNLSTGENAVWYMNGATRTGTAFLPIQSDMNWELKN